MTSDLQPVLDFRGNVMFHCKNCGAPLTSHDFFVLELRLPEHGESRDDYCDAELLDDLAHADCARIRRAG